VLPVIEGEEFICIKGIWFGILFYSCIHDCETIALVHGRADAKSESFTDICLKDFQVVGLEKNTGAFFPGTNRG
jgi:hypothetical protein